METYNNKAVSNRNIMKIEKITNNINVDFALLSEFVDPYFRTFGIFRSSVAVNVTDITK